MFENTIEELDMGVYNTTLPLYNDETDEDTSVSIVIDYDKAFDDETGELMDIDIFNVTFDEPFSFNGITYEKGATLADCTELAPFANKVNWMEEIRIEILDWAENLE